MPNNKTSKQDGVIGLLEKILVIQLFSLGASQDRIAKIAKRQKAWVDELVNGIPKGGRSYGNQEKNKKAKKRSRH